MNKVENLQNEILNVGLLIPTLNAGEKWSNVLQMILNQSIKIDRKIIIDSGSNDNTIKDAISYGFEIISIKKNEFNHGKTRQHLVDLADNIDICVFLTQDAILASRDSIANIVNAFDDPEVGMAYGRQLPHKNAQPLETHARLFNYPSNSEILSLTDLKQKGFKVFFCSNSFAAYRKSALDAVGGFPSDSIMGEDAIVAAKMLMAGFKKAYVADATVYHSHSYTIYEEFKRYFDTRVFHEQNNWLINKFGKPTGEGIRFINSELRYVIKNDLKSILKSIVSLGAKWMGYKCGKYYKKMPIKILKKISMHKFYWK
jgi:rhamnosyltransferase